MGRIADGGEACMTEGCSDPEPDEFACQNVVDASGRPADPLFVDALSDPFARFILQRPGECPQTFAETIAKLRLEDSSRCVGDERAGMLGRIVSQRAQLLGKSDVVRAVVGRQCGRRLPYELMFETPTIDADNPELPDTDLHVMGFDDDTAAFNFYSLRGRGEGATWTFHGNSFDMMARPESDCAECHSDGGLVMREIDAPWVHWESGAVRTVGAGSTIDRFAELGARSLGSELSETVKAGNAVWSLSRAITLATESRTEVHAGSTAQLLRPLFCGTSFNLQSAGQPDVLGAPTPVDALPVSFLVDPHWAVPGSVEVDAEAYRSTLLEVGSRIEGVVGPSDTYFGFTFVKRAAADVRYVQTLLDLEIVDEEFVLDVLAIDFTRPVFSAQRCGLLEFAPDFTDLDGTTEPPPPADLPSASTSCCQPHASAGCADEVVETCVCDQDSYCCDGAWDQSCVNRVVDTDPACGECAEPLRAAGGWGELPDRTAASPSPTRLRNAMFARLQAAEPEPGTSAAQLRDHLATPGQADAHRDRTRRFVEACEDRARRRAPTEFVHDALEVAAWRRREATAVSSLLDDDGVVAVDDLDPPLLLRLDPVDCEARAE